MVIPGREGMCCDAVIKHIERSSAASRTDVVDPEESGGNGRVDLQATVDGQVYALEHTRVQPFERRIEVATAYHCIKDHVARWFRDPLPGPAFYQLHVPVDAHLPGRGKAGERRLASLRDWIAKNVDVLDGRVRTEPSTRATARRPSRTEKRRSARVCWPRCSLTSASTGTSSSCRRDKPPDHGETNRCLTPTTIPPT